MDRPPSPLFRPAAVEAASGSQIGAPLTTHWRGVAVLTVVAVALLAALIAFVTLVEHAPVLRVAGVVDLRPDADEQVARAPDDALIVRLPVSPAAADSVRPGVDVKIALHAYPQAQFGLFAAKIDSVGANPSRGAAPQAAGGDGSRLVAVASSPEPLRGLRGEVLPVTAGMLADVLVPTEPRPVLAWLLDRARIGADGGADREPRGPVAEARR